MSQFAVPMYLPSIGPGEIAAAVAALETRWLGMGSFVQQFEAGLEAHVGHGRRVAVVSTGHAALHLGLLLLDVGPGDEVITPAFNNVADFQAILAVGARPVFCDIDKDTLCLDVGKAAKLVSDRTRAIIAMDYGSALADHDAVVALAARRGVRVLHDAAHSFGSARGGVPVGAFSDLCMFSFDPVKNITCIDGGALVLRDPAHVQRVHELRLIGMSQPAQVMYQNQRAWTYDVRALGFRYHMPNLHAAIGLAQLARLPEITATRRATCERYQSAFAELPELVLPRGPFEQRCPFLYTVLVPAGGREQFRQALAAHGVDSGIHWQPGHHFTLFRDCKKGDPSVTEDVAARIVSLPLHACMPEAHVERVIEAVQAATAEVAVG